METACILYNLPVFVCICSKIDCFVKTSSLEENGGEQNGFQTNKLWEGPTGLT